MESQQGSQVEPTAQDTPSLEWKEVVARKAHILEQIWAGPSPQGEQPVQPALDATSSLLTEYKNYQALVERAIEVFGDDLKAALWLSTPSSDLQNKVPLQIAQSVHYAADELRGIFEPVFLRIEHGIYT